MIYALAAFLGTWEARSRNSTVIAINITCVAVAYVGHGQAPQSFCVVANPEQKISGCCHRQLTT